MHALGVAMKLASCGYGVFAMDYPGFGLSEGLHGYIPNFDCLVDDVVEHFSKIKGRTLSPVICTDLQFFRASFFVKSIEISRSKVNLLQHLLET